MEWIKTEDKFPEVGKEIEIVCKHWEINWNGNFDPVYIEKGLVDEYGNFWDSEGPRMHQPSFWRPYQPERSKREDSQCINCFELEKACDNCFSGDGTCFKCGRLVRCGALNIVETQ